MFKSLFRSGRQLLEPNEQVLVEQWVSASPNPDFMRQYIDGLTSVRRIKPRHQVLLHRSKSIVVPYPSLKYQPGVISVLGIQYGLGGESGVATCAVSEGAPDTITSSTKIWDKGILEVVDHRLFEPISIPDRTEPFDGAVPEPVRLYGSATGQRVEVLGKPVSRWIEDLQWLSGRTLPPQLVTLFRDVGFIRVGDLQFCRTPEIFVYPAVVCAPLCAFEDGRFVLIFPVHFTDDRGIGVLDQVFQEARYFGDDLEAALAELVRVQLLEPDDCPFGG